MSHNSSFVVRIGSRHDTINVGGQHVGLLHQDELRVDRICVGVAEEHGGRLFALGFGFGDKVRVGDPFDLSLIVDYCPIRFGDDTQAPLCL